MPAFVRKLFPVNCNLYPHKGFTLVELLVAISIIAVLSAVGIAVFSNVSTKARDTTRKNDLKQIQIALELYYEIENKYPIVQTSGCVEVKSGALGEKFDKYLKTPPEDPKQSEDPEFKYCYAIDDQGEYTLTAKLENCEESNDSASTCTYVISSDESFVAQAPIPKDLENPPPPAAAPPPSCTSGYIDNDGDGYGSGPFGCHTGTVVSNNTDCYDSSTSPRSRNAFPGATAYSAHDRGDGSFDYNCDDIEEKRYPCYGSNSNADTDSSSDCNDPSYVKTCIDPATDVCGASGNPAPNDPEIDPPAGPYAFYSNSIALFEGSSCIPYSFYYTPITPMIKNTFGDVRCR